MQAGLLSDEFPSAAPTGWGKKQVKAANRTAGKEK
jgi:hypothetical protein